MLNARWRHDTLLRRYLTLTRERAEAQMDGSSPSRIQRLAVRERALAAALRGVRLHLGLPDTFDPELESARLGLDGKRRGRFISRTASNDRPQHEFRPRIRPVPSSPSPARRNGGRPAGDRAAPVVTVSDLLKFVASHDVDPDSEIVVRRLTGPRGTVEGGLTHVALLGLTDGRLRLDIR